MGHLALFGSDGETGNRRIAAARSSLPFDLSPQNWARTGHMLVTSWSRVGRQFIASCSLSGFRPEVVVTIDDDPDVVRFRPLNTRITVSPVSGWHHTRTRARAGDRLSPRLLFRELVVTSGAREKRLPRGHEPVSGPDGRRAGRRPSGLTQRVCSDEIRRFRSEPSIEQFVVIVSRAERQTNSE